MMAKTDTQLARAIELHRQRDLAGAAALYEKIIRRDPQNFFAHHALGAIHAEAGRAEAALPLLVRAARLAPDNAEAQANLGRPSSAREPARRGGVGRFAGPSISLLTLPNR